jgi:hypothetical protein
VTVEQLYEQVMEWRRIDQHDLQSLRIKVAELQAQLAELQQGVWPRYEGPPPVVGYHS